MLRQLFDWVFSECMFAVRILYFIFCVVRCVMELQKGIELKWMGIDSRFENRMIIYFVWMLKCVEFWQKSQYLIIRNIEYRKWIRMGNLIFHCSESLCHNEIRIFVHCEITREYVCVCVCMCLVGSRVFRRSTESFSRLRIAVLCHRMKMRIKITNKTKARTNLKLFR